ncbi:type II secretion system minor pseudopilin GspJ [Neptuniibacter sp. QD72_48]|uniref:type II secretion system minor pseudopilin GspJ n=1 Tax=unclassified Neptuniibacter TaxID=2630693 RepID=UPI0039F5BACD
MLQRKYQAGFTLIELIIAIAITALIGIAAQSMLDVMLRGKSQLSQQQERLSNLDNSLRVIQRDLQQITPRTLTGKDFITPNLGLLLRPQSQAVGSTFMEFIRFSTTPKPDQTHPDLIRVRYKLIDGDLIREQQPFPQNPLIPIPWHRIRLLQGLEELNISLFQQNWELLYTDLKSDNLPQAIKFEFGHPNWEVAELIVGLPGGDLIEP